MTTRRISFYGKGGIGKSTIAANVAAALATAGYRVLLIGCDPKADTTRNLTQRAIPTVLDVVRSVDRPQLDDILHWGALGVACVEAGGPEAGIGCAGLGISATMRELEQASVHAMDWDVVLYDVLGDVVCGGFSVPMRKKHVDTVFIVTSSDFMSIYAANNIMKAVKRHSTHGRKLLGGVIQNRTTSRDDQAIVEQFCRKTNAPYLTALGSYPEIQLAELQRATVTAAYPHSTAATVFRELAHQIIELDSTSIPEPLGPTELDEVGDLILRSLAGDV